MVSHRGNVNKGRFLLRRHAPLNIQGPGQYTPLLVAVEAVAQSARKIPMMESLLRSGADPWVRDMQGRTPMPPTTRAWR